MNNKLVKRIIILASSALTISLGSLVFAGQVANYSVFNKSDPLSAQQLEDNFSATIKEVNANATDIGQLKTDVQDATTALSSLQQQLPLGVNQTWQDVMAQRAGNSTYINDSGRPIMVNIGMQKTVTSGPNLVATLKVGQSTPPTISVGFAGSSNSAGEGGTISVIVPNNNYYNLAISSGNIVYWSELR